MKCLLSFFFIFRRCLCVVILTLTLASTASLYGLYASVSCQFSTYDVHSKESPRVVLSLRTTGKPPSDSFFEKIESAQGGVDLIFWESQITDPDLDRLAYYPNIVRIFFCGVPNLTDAAVEKLARLPNLTLICFDQVPQLKSPNFAALANCKKLERLELKRCADLTPEAFASLAHCGNNIVDLSVESCPVNDAALAQLANLQQLRSVDLLDCPSITDEGLRLLAKINQLRSVRLRNCPEITDAGLKPLSAAPQLRFIELVACPKLTEEFVASLESRKLAVGSDFLKDATGYPGIQPKKSLRLNFGGNGRDGKRVPFTDSDFERFNVASSPVELSFLYSEIADADLDRFADDPRVVSIVFYDVPNITDAVVEKLTRLPNLAKITLTQAPQLKNPDFATLAKCKKLKYMMLRQCANLTPEAFASLAHCGVKSLLFQSCPITDSDLAKLAENKSFSLFRLADCQAVTDAGVAEITKFSELQFLVIEGQPALTDAGIMQLSAASKLQNLYLLFCPKLTKEGVDALRQKLPKTTISITPFPR